MPDDDGGAGEMQDEEEREVEPLPALRRRSIWIPCGLRCQAARRPPSLIGARRNARNQSCKGGEERARGVCRGRAGDEVPHGIGDGACAPSVALSRRMDSHSRLRGNDGKRGGMTGQRAAGRTKRPRRGALRPVSPFSPAPRHSCESGNLPRLRGACVGAPKVWRPRAAALARGDRRSPTAHCAPNSSAVAVPSPLTSARSLG